MASKTVRINFQYWSDAANKLLQFTYMHNLSALLVDTKYTPSQVMKDDLYKTQFAVWMQIFVALHYQEALEATGPRCYICNDPRTTALCIPMSSLHAVDSHVNINVQPLCEKPTCATEISQEMQAVQMAKGQTGSIEGGKEIAKESYEIMPCHVCGKTEKTLKCVRCKVAYYCGKQHQKEDWLLHKASCKAPPKGHPV